MATDVRLDEGDGTFLVLDARVVKAVGSDFMLDLAERRKDSRGVRRALVHDQNDGLTVNFNGDYPGGVTLVGVAEIIPQSGSTFIPNLVVRGGISFEIEALLPAGPFPPIAGFTPARSEVRVPTRVTVSLADELSKLQSQISELSAKVAALEALPDIKHMKDEEIAKRAYDLFEQRGRQHGDDWKDWFHAEDELPKGQ